MRWKLEMKMLPEVPPDTTAEDMNPTPQADVPRWSGDVYEMGDESDPADAFAHLTSPDGVEAWLDRAEDGTLTGWLRDLDGTVYRYSDPAGWAIDVDEAGLKNAGSAPAADGEDEPEEDEPADDEDGNEPDVATDADGVPLDEVEPGLDNRNKRFSFEGKSYEITYL